MKSPVRVIKKEQREALEAPPASAIAVDPDRWSKVVRTWVSDFKQQRVEETLPAFDSLFKDASS